MAIPNLGDGPQFQLPPSQFQAVPDDEAMAAARTEQETFLNEQRRAAALELSMRSFGDNLAATTSITLVERAEVFFAYIRDGRTDSSDDETDEGGDTT